MVSLSAPALTGAFNSSALAGCRALLFFQEPWQSWRASLTEASPMLNCMCFPHSCELVGAVDVLLLMLLL